ncbi:MAG: SDR family NAD(P)-dependent oxidoreductase, partial [Spirochaetales bacterium]|nr:SDR family NAD(P)-dependent oxidoreductase [Spirochaetales bacterium]
MSSALKDRVAIITGGGRGLGKAFALRYAQEGARLLLADINLQTAEETADEIKSKGGEAAVVKTDVSDEKSTDEMAEKAVQLYGRVDILLNNAGIWQGVEAVPWDTWKVEDWNRILSVNLIGMWLCCKSVVPHMVKAGGGKIVNIASVVAKVPAAQFFLPYACSKGAVYTLTHALARSLGPSGINVNGIAPGLVSTEASLSKNNIDNIYDGALSEASIARREQPEDLLGTAVFLASAESN